MATLRFWEAIQRTFVVMMLCMRRTMKKNTSFVTSLLIAGCWLISFYTPSLVSAEMYVAGQGGVNFADRINSIAGTGSQAGAPGGPSCDFDLQKSITYGGKVGYFPGHSWYGIEGEVFHTTPHIKAVALPPQLFLLILASIFESLRSASTLSRAIRGARSNLMPASA